MSTSEIQRPTSESGDPAVSLGWVGSIVATVMVVIVAGRFAERLGDVIGLVLAAAVLAVGTLPVRRWAGRYVGIGAATVATAVLTTVVSLAAALLAFRDLSARADQVAELTQRRLDEIEPGSLIDRVVSAVRLDDAIAGWLDRIPNQVILGADGGGAIATQLFLFLTVVILAAFLQSSGSAIVGWVCARWPRHADGDDDAVSHRRTAHLLVDEIEQRGFGFFRRVLVLIAASATVVAVTGASVGFPGAVVLGLWVGSWAVVPVVGPVVALSPVALLYALDQRPVGLVVVAVSIAVVVAVVVARRRWLDGLLPLGAAPYVIAVAAGVAVGGMAGSAVALALVAAVATWLTSDLELPRPTLWNVPPDRARTLLGVTVPTGWRLAALGMAATGAGVCLWVAIDGAGRFLVWLLVGGFVAVALGRPVAWLDRRTALSRVGACAVVCGVIGAALFAAALTGADDGARATSTLTERLPEIVADFEDMPLIGGWLEQHDAAVWVQDQMNDLPQRVRTGRPADWLPYVGSRLVDLFWTIVIAVALLVDGGRVVDAVGRRVPARHRRQWNRLLGAAATALGGYAAGAALVAGINASVIFTVAVVLGLGVAPALALWGFVWNFVPQIGGFMGGLPLIVFAFVLGPAQGLLAAVVFIAYQFLENNVIQPAVIGASIDVAPWGTLVAALAGGAAAGVAGAIVLTPLVGVIGVVRRELASADFPGATVSVPDDLAPAVVTPGRIPG